METARVETADLDGRLRCVAGSWTPRQRLHAGDVAWQHARGDGSTTPDRSPAWGDPLRGFADIWLSEPAATLHLGPATTARQALAAVDEVLAVVPHVTVQASLQEPHVVGALTRRGFRRAGGAWFVQLWRSLQDLPAVPAPFVRPVRRDETAARVEVHRRCWDPARVKRLLGLPVTGDEPGSGYSVAKHRAVMGSPLYRAELDLVAEAADGSLAGFALGWLDPLSRSVLFEPVGTVPEHARRGVARALCAEMLRVARDLGATQAVVHPRGDDAYPVPRRLYEGLGMREVGQIVPYTNREE